MKEHLLYFLSGCLLTALVFTFLQVAFADAPNPGHTADEIEDLPASKITSGVFDTARLGSGTSSSSTFLRGDQAWADGWGSSGAISIGATECGGYPCGKSWATASRLCWSYGYMAVISYSSGGSNSVYAIPKYCESDCASCRGTIWDDYSGGAQSYITSVVCGGGTHD